MLPINDEFCFNKAWPIKFSANLLFKNNWHLIDLFLYTFLDVNACIISLHVIHPLSFLNSLKKKCFQIQGSVFSVYRSRFSIKKNNVNFVWYIHSEYSFLRLSTIYMPLFSAYWCSWDNYNNITNALNVAKTANFNENTNT